MTLTLLMLGFNMDVILGPPVFAGPLSYKCHFVYEDRGNRCPQLDSTLQSRLPTSSAHAGVLAKACTNTWPTRLRGAEMKFDKGREPPFP